MPKLRRAPMMASVLIALASAFSVLTAGPAAASTAGDAIATRALQDLGTYQGQCYTWMEQVVQDAIGVSVGNDYRFGYLDSGFVEVSAAQAQRGDIIQIDDDSDSSPYSNFPGLHTVIILANLGGGLFNGIDANQNWDGIVRYHDGFDPAAAAARYPGGAYHIYHFAGSAGASSGNSGASVQAPTPAAPQFVAGDTATTNTPPPDPYLNLRKAPGLGAGLAAVLPNGSSLTVTGTPTFADGYWWVAVTSPSGAGWVAAPFLINTTPAPPPTTTYTVVSGDTLSTIATQFGVSLDALESANSIADANLITVGTLLTIPAGGSSPPAATAGAAPVGSTYVVQAGDTVSGIAGRFGVGVGTLESANNIVDGNLIVVGTVLTIPGTNGSGPPSGVATSTAIGTTYTVVAGDTLDGIAAQYGVDVGAIEAANSLGNPSLIMVGSVLTIP